MGREFIQEHGTILLSSGENDTFNRNRIVAKAGRWEEG